MKKVKILSICVIILSVIALGILSGKHFFSYLENKASTTSGKDAKAVSTQPTLFNPTPAIPNPVVLYSAATGSTHTPGPKAEPAAASAEKPAITANVPVAVSSEGSPASAAETKSASESQAFDPSKAKWIAFASGDGVNVRDLPSVEKPSKVVMKIGKGTKGTVLERKDGWSNVKWDFNKKTGWTRDDLLITGPEDALKAMPSEKNGMPRISSEAVQLANKKAANLAKTISVAVAKPAPASETVKGLFGDKPPTEGVVTASPFARVRATPNKQGAEVGRVPKGITVKIKSFKQLGRYHWFEIIYGNGKKEGWTREDNLRF